MRKDQALVTGDMCWYIERCTATPSGLLLFFLAARGVICGIVCSMISAGGGWQCWCCLARFVLACTSGSSDADAGSVFPWGARLTQEICVRLLRDPHSY
ncbi:putative transmembrane protein, partial [Toxoplasma gondii MAS]